MCQNTFIIEFPNIYVRVQRKKYTNSFIVCCLALLFYCFDFINSCGAG